MTRHDEAEDHANQQQSEVEQQRVPICDCHAHTLEEGWQAFRTVRSTRSRKRTLPFKSVWSVAAEDFESETGGAKSVVDVYDGDARAAAREHRIQGNHAALSDACSD